MTHKFLFTGIRSFSNRGVEAIVRGTQEILKSTFGSPVSTVPIEHVPLNRRQWDQSDDDGIEFIPIRSPRLSLPILQRLVSLPFQSAKTAQYLLPVDPFIEKVAENSHAALSLGGDKYSLDYRYPIYQTCLDHACMNRSAPIILWGASVGPFTSDLAYESLMVRHLSRFDAITVREDLTLEYLTKLGLTNLVRVSDPAFLMEPTPLSNIIDWPQGELGVVGLNISPILTKRSALTGKNLIEEVAQFIRWLWNEGFGVVLIPHVWPLDGVQKNSDVKIHSVIAATLGEKACHNRLLSLSQSYNAPQMKWIISQCRFFVGARTHATIAALSTGVPTVFLGYSIKSRGISLDVLGNENSTIDGREITTHNLCKIFEQTIANESTIRGIISRNLPLIKMNAMKAGEVLKKIAR